MYLGTNRIKSNKGKINKLTLMKLMMIISLYLEAHFALKRFDAGVYVSVLLQTAGCGESFSTFWTSVRACSDMVSAYVTLEVRRVGKNLKVQKKTLLPH